MRVSALVVLACLALIACSEPAGWIGDDPHVVEGYWVLAETPCAMAPGDECTVAVDAAMAETGLTLDGTARTSTAEWTSGYRDGGGRSILATTGGIVHFSAVIIDLADGSRRLVNVLCGGPITTDDGTVVSPPTCDAHSDLPFGQRVGNEPWFHLP